MPLVEGVVEEEVMPVRVCKNGMRFVIGASDMLVIVERTSSRFADVVVDEEEAVATAPLWVGVRLWCDGEGAEPAMPLRLCCDNARVLFVGVGTMLLTEMDEKALISMPRFARLAAKSSPSVVVSPSSEECCST